MRRALARSLFSRSACALSAALLAGASALSAMPVAAFAQEQVDEAGLRARMTPDQAKVYDQWQQARAAHDVVHNRYWDRVTALKAERKRKRAAGIAWQPADFVREHAPKYTGPALRADIAKMIAEVKPTKPDRQMFTIADALASAAQNYGFTPRLTNERDFKRSYAIESLAAGLTKDQVVRVYALETGGRGTFDMQAGYDPITRQGRPISTAVGYAQLLGANSIDELIKHGEGFITRLSMMAAAEDTPRTRASELVAKVQAIRAMLKVARSVPREWSEHEQLAKTIPGIGIHAINLDADIGPWLQALKLKGLKDLADKNGRPQMTGAEIELMNLAGPRTGLDMMEPVAQTASTSNFFAQGGYYRNTIVREKTAAELLIALDGRMNENLRQAGSIEFAEVFDEVIASGAAKMRPVNYLMSPPKSAAPAKAAATSPVGRWAPTFGTD